MGRTTQLKSHQGRLAQLVRAAGLQPAGRGFESRSAHQLGRCTVTHMHSAPRADSYFTQVGPFDTLNEPHDVATLMRGFELSLRAKNRSRKTIGGYMQTVSLFRAFLISANMPTAVDRIERSHVEAFVADQLERWKPKTAQVRYGDLRQFFNWCAEEGECDAHPMARMKPPFVPEVLVPVVSDNDLRRLLKACDGSSFENKRDTATLRVFAECGLRLGEMTALEVKEVDFDYEVLVVMEGKGRRSRKRPVWEQNWDGA